MKPDCNCGGIFFCRHPWGWGNYIEAAIAILFGVALGCFVVTLLAACTSEKIGDCVFICPPGVSIPDGCYCQSDKIRDEIHRESKKLGVGR